MRMTGSSRYYSHCTISVFLVATSAIRIGLPLPHGISIRILTIQNKQTHTITNNNTRNHHIHTTFLCANLIRHICKPIIQSVKSMSNSTYSFFAHCPQNRASSSFFAHSPQHKPQNIRVLVKVFGSSSNSNVVQCKVVWWSALRFRYFIHRQGSQQGGSRGSYQFTRNKGRTRTSGHPDH